MAGISNLYYRKYHLGDQLDDFVKYAWVMKAYELKSKPDLLIPDGYPEIIFVKKGAYCKNLLEPGKPSVVISKSCIVGIQTQSVVASRMDNCYLIGLKLKPAGAYSLFGSQLKNILNANKPLNEFGAKWICDLDQKLQKSSEEDEVIELLSETLLHQVKCLEKDATVELATSFLRSVLIVKGQVSVQELAKQHCLSVRHFQRKFKGFFGITPKKFLNIIRFKHLYKASVLRQKLPDDFLEYGYYDQMHFIKDFRKHLGVNPSKSAEATFVEMNKMAQLNT